MFRLLILLLFGIVLPLPAASAGWVCLKNESKVVLVVREVVDRPSLRRGKVVKLLPGEVYREHQTAAGERRVQVFDARNLTRPLCSAKLTWTARDDTTYKFEAVEKTVRLTHVVPAKSPTVPKR
jgi:hypothetical protein